MCRTGGALFAAVEHLAVEELALEEPAACKKEGELEEVQVRGDLRRRFAGEEEETRGIWAGDLCGQEAMQVHLLLAALAPHPGSPASLPSPAPSSSRRAPSAPPLGST